MKEKATLNRVFHRLSKEEAEKARKYALAQSGKSRTSGITHREFAKTNEQFREACELAEIEPTRRQAQKYRLGQGSAFAAREAV